MNAILKKRFREKIRKHYEDNYARSYERKKEMYRIFGIMDEVMDDVVVDDLLPMERLRVHEIIYELTRPIIEYPTEKLLDTTQIFPMILPNGKEIEMIVTFKKG